MSWQDEKEELEKTYDGWFVAYQDGERIALEPDCDKLVFAMDAKSGSPRNSCEFYEIGVRTDTLLSPRYSGGITEFSIDPDLFEALINVVINAKAIREFPKEVRDELEEHDRDVLDIAVNTFNEYQRRTGGEEIH